MYKVFSGGKSIIISSDSGKSIKSKSNVIEFVNVELLHKEYLLFIKSDKWDNLIITGDEERAWSSFLSMFLYIEAAGGVVRNLQGELLMIYRNNYWDMPKGKMEDGEIPAQTALREVEEECGIKKLTIVRPLISTYHIYLQNKKNCIKRTYWFEMLSADIGDLVPQKEEGIVEARWMKREEVKKIIKRVYVSLQEVIVTTFLS